RVEGAVQVDPLDHLAGLDVALGQLGIGRVGLVTPNWVDDRGERHYQRRFVLAETNRVLRQVQRPDAGLDLLIAILVGLADEVRRGELVGLFELRRYRESIRLAEALALPALPRMLAD